MKTALFNVTRAPEAGPDGVRTRDDDRGLLDYLEITCRQAEAGKKTDSRKHSRSPGTPTFPNWSSAA